jgi:hypothetical protein
MIRDEGQILEQRRFFSFLICGYSDIKGLYKFCEAMSRELCNVQNVHSKVVKNNVVCYTFKKVTAFSPKARTFELRCLAFDLHMRPGDTIQPNKQHFQAAEVASIDQDDATVTNTGEETGMDKIHQYILLQLN